MRNFIIGFILGGVLLGSASALTRDPLIVGDSGTLWFITVENADGDTLCSDPEWQKPTKTIVCDD